MRKLLIVLIILASLQGWREWQQRPVVHDPGILIPVAPVQRNLLNVQSFLHGGFSITPRASFDIQARVLGRERYYLGADAGLSPLDLALGWQKMSDQSILDQMTITQGGRWYFTRYELPAPLSDQDIILNSSNMHMIPADNAIESELKKLRPGELVRITGYLVDVDNDSGWKWRTSLTRGDTGQGACEIVYVEDIFKL